MDECEYRGNKKTFTGISFWDGSEMSVDRFPCYNDAVAYKKVGRKHCKNCRVSDTSKWKDFDIPESKQGIKAEIRLNRIMLEDLNTGNIFRFTKTQLNMIYRFVDNNKRILFEKNVFGGK